MSDSKSKLFPAAKETLMSMESPVGPRSSRPPSDPPEDAIDKGLLLAAWNASKTSSMAMLEQMELMSVDNVQTRRDNKVTRWHTTGSTAVILLVCGALIWKMAGVERVMEAGAARLANVESTIGLVADSVVRTNEAASAEAEAVVVGVSSVPYHETTQPLPLAPVADGELQKAAAEARMGAQASALKAQAQIAENRGAEAVTKVKRKARKLRKRAALQKLSDPFADIGEIEPDASFR